MRFAGRLVMTVGMLLCIGGGVVGWDGWKERKLAANSTPAPVAIDLAKLEGGASPGNNHIKIGPHYAYYGNTVYTYEESAGHQVLPSSRVTHAFYAIASPEHPDVKELEAVAKKYNGLANVPLQELPSMNHFVVLIKTKRFKTVGEIDNLSPIVHLDGAQGLIINEVEPLEKGDKDLIIQRFPNVNFDKVLIVEVDRKPTDPATATWMLIGGGAMLLVGIPIFLGGLFVFIKGGW